MDGSVDVLRTINARDGEALRRDGERLADSRRL